MFRRIDVFQICLSNTLSQQKGSMRCISLKDHHLCQPLALRIAIGLALNTEQPNGLRLFCCPLFSFHLHSHLSCECLVVKRILWPQATKKGTTTATSIGIQSVPIMENISLFPFPASTSKPQSTGEHQRK